MKPQEIRNAIEKFAQFAHPLDGWFNDLQILKQDLSLSSEYEYYYAVDFAELFFYAYPGTERQILNEKLKRRALLLNDSEFYRDQITLALMFRKFMKPLIQHAFTLLPPHMLEFEDHMTWVTEYLLKSIAQPTLPNAGALPQTIQQIYEKRKNSKDKNLTIEEAKLFVQFVENEYRDYLGWVACRTAQRFNRMKELMSSGGSVVSLYDTFPKIDIDFNDIRIAANGPLETINLIRPQPERAYNNYIDALSCGYLTLINEKINPEKKILVFVTHSFAMQQALKSIKVSIPFQGELHDVPVLRNKNILLAYFLHRGSNDEETLELIDTSLNLSEPFGKFKQMYEKLQILFEHPKIHELTVQEMNVIIDGDVETVITRASQLVEAFEKYRKSNTYENLRMACMQGEDTLAQLFNEIREDLDRDLPKELQNALDSVNFIRNDANVKKNLESSLASITRDLGQDGRGLSLLQELQRDDFSTMRSIAKKFNLRNLATLTLTKDLSELCYYPSFRQPETRQLADTILKPSVRRTYIALADEYAKLLSIVSKGETHPESLLLQAYIFGSDGRLDDALACLETALNQPGIDNKVRSEILFWKAVILRNKSSSLLADSLRCCSEALGIQRSEHRFLCEKSFILWQLAEERPTEFSVNDAAPLMEEALASSLKLGLHGDPVYLNILNNLSNIYAETGSQADIEKAINLADEMETLWRWAWPPFFRGTLAFISYLKASRNMVNKVALMNSAKDEMTQLLAKSSMPPWQEAIVHRHLALIENAIQRI